MPFINRLIEPQHLSRKPLDKSVQDDLEAVTNSTLVEALKQLACLVVFADEIFQELTCQVKTIQSRTEKLKSNIERVDDIVSRLNAKEVHVPVGDLDKFSRLTQHYVSSSTSTWSPGTLFTPATRPACVRRLYEAAVVSPVCIIRQIDHYRQDGRRASKYFLCLPFFKDVKVNFDMEIEMRRPASLSGARDWLSDDDTLESIVLGPPTVNLDGSLAAHPESDSRMTTSTSTTTVMITTAAITTSPPEAEDGVMRVLPTPELKTYVMSLRYPYSDVPIDVTGTGFRRMASLRRSFMQHMDNITKRKRKSKRRNTVAGNNDEGKVMEAMLKSSGTQTCESLTMEGNPSSHNKMDASDGDVTAGSLKKNKKSSQKKLLFLHRTDQKDLQGAISNVGQRENSEKESGGTFRWFQRKSRNRNSIIGGIGVYEELDRVKKVRRGFLASLMPASMSSSESGGSPSKSSTSSALASAGTTVNGRSRSAKNSRNRMSLPISTSSQAVTVAVRMRESSARGNSAKDDGGGQSSSGNWSASSSTRTSMESEEHVVGMTASALLTDSAPRTGSQTSLDKDSALSDGTTPNEDRWPDSNNDYHSDSTTHSSVPKSSLRFPRRSVETDTVRWLQSLDEEGALGRSAGDTTDAASSTGTLTPRIRRRAMSPSDFPSPFVDDGESSEFSVDTDGYYTSMHTDSGLRPLPSRGRREGSATSGKLSRLSDLRERDSNSSLCSLESVGDKTLRASGPLTTALLKKDTGKASQTVERAWDHFGTAKKIPPLPPPRTSTLTAQGSVRGESPAYPVYGSRNQAMAASSSSSSSSTSSKFDDAAAVPSDSEASEANEKFIQKMSIDTGQIPSLCVVTPSGSDDEDEKKGQDQSDEVLRAAKEAIDAVSKVGMTSVGQAPQPPYATPVRSCVSDTILISSAQCPTPRQVLCNPSDNKESPKVTANNWSHNFMGSVVYEPDVIFLKEQAPLASGPKGQLPRIIPGSDIKSFSQQNSTSPHPHPDCSSPSNGLPSPCVTSTSIPPGSGVTNGRPGARVTLDSSGQVIHSTGSLPRRRSTSMSPVTSPTQEQSPTVFPGTSTPSTGSNSKCSSQGNRQGAYVRLDPTGSIPVTRQVQQSHHVQGKMSHLPTLKPPEERSLLSVSTVQPRRYDSNTLPRWKPPEANRPVPIFPNEIKTQGAGGDLQSYHVGTFPRRWNNFNFLRRDASSPVPKPPTQAPQPEQIVSSGGYLRLDGHPTHLEPGIPSRPVAGAGLTMGPQMQPRSEPSQSKVCPSPGPFSKSPSSRTSDGSSPPSPPVAMPLMQHLSYGNRTTTRIPTTLSGPCGSPNLMAPAVRPQQETLPPYYRPLITDPQSSSWKDTGGTGTRTTVNNEQAFHPPTANRIHMASPPPPNYITTPPLPSGACPPPLLSPSAYDSGPTRPAIVSQTFGSTRPNGHLGSPPPGYSYSTAGYSQSSMATVSQNPLSPLHKRAKEIPSRGIPQTSTYLQPQLTLPHLHNGMQRAQTPAGDPESNKNVDLGLNPSTSSLSTVPLSSSPTSVQRPLSVAPQATMHSSTSTHVCETPSLPTNSKLQSSPRGLRPENGERLDVGAPKNVMSPRTTMSTDDLFAIIHQSKKKMNVKTDLELSISPSSSRSGSPALSVGAQPRSGALVPGSRSPLYVPGDRRSWSGDLMSSPSATLPKAVSSTAPGDRRSWASDRLGPIRPTSMHNFKLLLLQAGRGNNKEAAERRQTASELLKASPSSCIHSNGEPALISPNRPFVQSSPRSPQGLSPHRQATPSAAKQVYHQGHLPSLSPPPTTPNSLISPSRSFDLNSSGGSSTIYARPNPRINLLNSRLQNKPFQGRSRATCSVLHNRTDILSTPIMEDEYSDEDDADDFCGLAVRSSLQSGLNVTPVAAS